MVISCSLAIDQALRTKDGIHLGHCKKNCLLELSADIVAVGCIVRVDPRFYFSYTKKLVCEQSAGPNNRADRPNNDGLVVRSHW